MLYTTRSLAVASLHQHKLSDVVMYAAMSMLAVYIYALNLVTRAGRLIRGQILYTVLAAIDPPELPVQQQLMLHANSEDRPFTRFSHNKRSNNKILVSEPIVDLF